MRKGRSTYSTWTKYLTTFSFSLLCWASHSLTAQDYDSDPTQGTIHFKAAKNLIRDIRADKLDYLENEIQLKEVFESSKNQNWEALHVEAAVLYAELLFRQERYDEQNTHINIYLEKEPLQDQWDLYLLLLESHLKYLSRQEDPSAAQELSEQLNLWLPQRQPQEKIIIYRALAYYYTSVDALKKTLQVSLEGLELSILQNNPSAQGFFLRKIADAYNYLDEKDKAVEYAQKSVIAYEKTQDKHFTAKAYWSLGNAYIDIQKPQKAVGYFKKALRYFKSVNMQKGIVFAQYSIAIIQFKESDFEEAINNANENIVRANAAGVFDMQLASMILLSDIYIKKGELKKANDMNDEVFTMIDKFSRSIYKSNFLEKRYKLKKRLGHNDDAFEAIEKQLLYTKKHLEATSESNIKTLQVKFDVKEKEDRILQLAHEKDISELKAKKDHQQSIIWRLSAAIAFILVIVSLLLVYYQMLQRQRYHSIALTDYLTKAPNRRGIMRIAEDKIHEQEVTVAIIDLDYFKKINDNFGHNTGDLVLIAFAKAATKTLRESDSFGRYGGEEWLLILNTTKKAAITKIFDRLKENFSKYCIDITEGNLPKDWVITFSMGAIINNLTDNNLNDLIRQADKLLYRAKENGRNQAIIEDYIKT